MTESQKVKDALDKRASALADRVLEWRRMAEQRQYPESLVGILRKALEHERKLARRQRESRR